MSRYADENRTPLMRDEWDATFERMRERADAPKRTAECGDRLRAEDLARVRDYAATLENAAGGMARDRDRAAAFVREMAARSPHLARLLGPLDPARDWDRVPRTGRETLRDSLAEFVPPDEDLSRLIVNTTSGTTGEPLRVPSHPATQGCYDPLIERALRSRGIELPRGPGRVAGVQVCFQRRTLVYDTVHSYRDGAGFAKVNLDARAWPKESAASWLPAMEPGFLSGDPAAFEELLALGIRPATGALLSTAAALQPGLRAALEEAFGAPVIDFYSANDTGPLAFSDPDEQYDAAGRVRMRPLPSDVYFEVTDPDGVPLPDGEFGELVVTGGRNPFVPLFRWRTGDVASLSEDARGTVLTLSGGRKAILFRLPDGGRLNPVDVARVMLDHPVRRHRVLARRDGSFEVRIACPGFRFVRETLLRDLEPLFPGARVDLVEGFEGVPEKAPPFEEET